MTKPVLSKPLTTALNKAIKDLTIDLSDVTEHDGNTIGCHGSVTHNTEQHIVAIDTAYRPRDTHQMAVLKITPADDQLGYAVMVPNTAKFIAEHIATIFDRLAARASQKDDDDVEDNTEDDAA